MAKVLWDARLYKPMPDMPGLRKLPVWYDSHETMMAVLAGDERTVRDMTRKLVRGSDALCLNWEGPWAQAAASLDRARRRAMLVPIIQAMRWIREEVGTLGFFFWPPVAIDFAGRAPEDLKRIEEAAEDIEPVAELVDVLFPEGYVHEKDLDVWRKRSAELLARCRRYQKPVYPFIAPHYAHWAPKEYRWQLIPVATLKAVVAWCLRETDGLVAWGGGDLSQSPFRTLPWDDRSAYAQALRYGVEVSR